MSSRELFLTFYIDAAISARNVIRHWRRSFAGSAAICAGVIALILTAGFIEWIYWGMREGTIRSGLGHIQVVSAGYREHGMADPFRYLLPQHSPEQGLIATVPHVVGVAPRLKFAGLISLGNATLSFMGTGLDAGLEGGLDNVTALEGSPLSDIDPTGVLLGRGLAANLGAKVGDTVVLLVNRRDGAIHGVDAKVRGLFSTVTKAYDDVAVHVPFGTANEMLRAAGAHVWVMYLDDTRNTANVARVLRQSLSQRFEIVPWYEAADFYQKTVKLFSRQVLVMKLIIAIVVVLSISNTMMSNVIGRTSEIATSLALGVTRKRLLGRFLLEGIFVGLLGGLLGVALGYGMARVVNEIGIPMPPPPGMARGFTGQILVSGGLVADALLLAGITAVLGTLYPAWTASRTVIADALRHAG